MKISPYAGEPAEAEILIGAASGAKPENKS